MAAQDNASGSLNADSKGTIKLYAALALLLVVIALISTAVTSLRTSGGGASRCGVLALQSDRYGCVMSIAVSTRNSSMCGTLQEPYADGCYLQIAENQSDPKLCYDIRTTSMADNCFLSLAYSTMDPQVCLGINGSLGSQCAFRVAVASNNTGYCRLVNGSEGQLQCNDTIYIGKAVDHYDTAYCQHVANNSNTSYTEGVAQNLSFGGNVGLGLNLTQSIEYASLSGQTLGARDLCYMSVAYGSRNSAYCGDIQNANLSSECSLYIGGASSANLTENASAILNLCSSEPGNSTACTYGAMTLQALSSGNVSICKKIPSPYSFSCFYYIATKYNDTAYCNYITNSTENSACVAEVEGLYPANVSSGV